MVVRNLRSVMGVLAGAVTAFLLWHWVALAFGLAHAALSEYLPHVEWVLLPFALIAVPVCSLGGAYLVWRLVAPRAARHEEA